MSRWGRNIVVPLDTCKDSTNRPTVSHSLGTMGKWGKMGFTSTRTYTMSALAIGAASVSPQESPASHKDDDLSISVPDPPKPRRFFKSRNTTPPEVIAQIMQQLPHQSTSPSRDASFSYTTTSCVQAIQLKEPPVKLKAQRSNSVDRKKKSPKKIKPKTPETSVESCSIVEQDHQSNECKPPSKKKKVHKQLKPEAPPSRVLSRTRKSVNYCEVDDEDRLPAPIKGVAIMNKTDMKINSDDDFREMSAHNADDLHINCRSPDSNLLPPAIPQPTNNIATSVPSKTPEHPPIVLRISKGTSRLVSSDSEEHMNASLTPSSQHSDGAEVKESRNSMRVALTANNEDTSKTILPKILVKPTKSPTINGGVDPTEINYSTVKISPEKPPKERLKLIIKTDVIRNAIAAAAAMTSLKDSASDKPMECSSNNKKQGYEHFDKDKPKKHKKNKHLKHTILESLSHQQSSIEFKTPSPHLTLGYNSTHDSQQTPSVLAGSARTVISPAGLSEKDFDSQSSVLGSISSKGYSTPQGLAPIVEESCVLYSRGSSDITSDLETSQHSSLVAPPSDIELRLESMMMDTEGSHQQRSISNFIEAEPLQEDILSVLRGDESLLDHEQNVKTNGQNSKIKLNATDLFENEEESQLIYENPVRQTTRRKLKSKISDCKVNHDTATNSKTKYKKAKFSSARLKEQVIQKRFTRNNSKIAEKASLDCNETVNSTILTTSTKDESSDTLDKSILNVNKNFKANQNSINNVINNNINKIADNLSAKAGAAKLKNISKCQTLSKSTTQRSYGRKRKNQQVTQVLQPSIEDLEKNKECVPSKQPYLEQTAMQIEKQASKSLENQYLSPNRDMGEINSSNYPYLLHANDAAEGSGEGELSPPRCDYMIKDKFKRTLTINSQVDSAVVDNAEQSTQIPAKIQNQAEPAVKLVISKKKGSIFKSRVPSELTDQGSSKRHLYKHRWDAAANGDGGIEGSGTSTATADVRTMNATADVIYNDFNSDDTLNSPLLNSKTIRTAKTNFQSTAHSSSNLIANDTEMSVESSRADRTTKDFYTVVRNVKTAHQIQEIGEYQEMDDDVEYILDALQPHNPMSTRCLSALQLAAKCMVPAFRMHVRAHGVVAKFFKSLSDANQDLSLGLCTSAIMYILSQEGLNMDLDRDSLELMMNLLESEQTVAAPADHVNYERNKQKVRELCEEIKALGKATHLNVESITVGTLAMETLLSLTSKRAGDWFKEELRELGGLEHIIKTINDCSKPTIDNTNCKAGVTWNRSLLDNMKTVERCLRVLENVTQLNEENQRYILTYSQSNAVNTLCSLLYLCDRELILNARSELANRENPSIVMLELLMPLMKVLINLTHPFSASNTFGAELIGQQNEVISTCFHLLLQAPNYIPDRCVFELSILVLLLLINLTMYTIANRARIMEAFAPSKSIKHCDSNQDGQTPAVSAIMSYFYKCEELAKLVERNTDAFLDKQDKNKKKQEEVDETVNNLLQKAGHHMEHSMKGSYTAILIGQLIIDNEQYEAIIRKHLHGNGFKEIISVLEKYYNFMNLTASAEASVVAHIKSTKVLLDYFKKRDLLSEMNADTSSVPLNLEVLHNGEKNVIMCTTANTVSVSSAAYSNH